jgi:hypothetical protein
MLRKLLEPIGLGIALTIGFALTVAILVYPKWQEIWDLKLNELGDFLAGISSTLAFIWIIIAVLLQRDELQEQRKELRQSREALTLQAAELKRTATAQEDSREALRQTIYAHAFKTAYDVLQSEEVRDARKTVFSFNANIPFEQWGDHATRAGELTCNAYDIVGIMVRHDLLPVHYIVDSWGDSLRRSWPILKSLVEHQRRMRDANEFWDDYEFLVQAAIKYQREHSQHS